METSNSNYKKLKLVTKVKIMNYPSKDMIIHLLNNFLSENKLQKDYVILERSLFLLIKFKDSDTAFSFVKRLNYEKLINHYYSSIEVTMNIDIDKKKEKNIGKSVSLPRLFNKNSKTENTNHTIEISKYYKPSIKKIFLLREKLIIKNFKCKGNNLNIFIPVFMIFMFWF
jgi:hypothetical protein